MPKLFHPPQFSVKEHVQKSTVLVKQLILVLIIAFLTVPELITAQCLTAPASPPCNPAGSTALVNNDIVAAGQIKTVNGTSVFSGLTVSGGTLIVCGSLTISSFVFNSGVIIVNPGATMQINPSMAIVFGNNSSIYNFGNFTIAGSIVTGQNNIIYNVSTGSVFTVAFNQLVLQGPNTYLINNGIFNSSFFIVQATNSPGPVCSGIGSAIQTNIMINQFANAFTSPNGPSCINIVQWIINSQPMTSTPSVGICYLASNVSIVGSANFGNATVNNNCPSCGVLLPLRIKNFTGLCENGLVSLKWSSETTENIKRFEIEQSDNGTDFTVIGSVPVEGGNEPGAFTYNFVSDRPESSILYYRIRQIDNNNNAYYSNLVSTSCEITDAVIISDLVNGVIKISTPKKIESISIYDMSGKTIKEEVLNNETNVRFNHELLARGFYILRLKTADGEFISKKFILN